MGAGLQEADVGCGQRRALQTDVPVASPRRALHGLVETRACEGGKCDPDPVSPPGLVREQEAGLLQFLRLDGFSVLMRAMQQQVQKLKVKSAFLLQNLLVGHPEHKGGPGGGGQGPRQGVRSVGPSSCQALPAGTLCAMGMVQQLVALVRTEHSPFHEYVLGALCRCAGAGRRGMS